MTKTATALYVLGNILVFFLLAAATGQLGPSAAAVAILNIGFVLARRILGRTGAPVEQEVIHVIRALNVALRRGHTVPAALRAAREAAGPRLDAPFQDVVMALELGEPLEEAIASAHARHDLPPGLSAALWATLFAKEAGTSLPDVLDRLTESVEYELDLDRRLQAKTLHGRITAMVLALLPVFLGAYLLPFRPDIYGSLMKTSWGAPMLGGLLAIWIAGLVIIVLLSGSWGGRRRAEEQRIESEVPLLADLVAEGADLDMEPHGLLSRLERSMPPGPLRREIDKVLAETDLGTPLLEALQTASSRSPSRAFRTFSRTIAETGTSRGAGDVLHGLARELRTESHHQMALQVQKMPFYLIAVLVLFVFPLTLGMLVLPIVATTSALLGQ